MEIGHGAKRKEVIAVPTLDYKEIQQNLAQLIAARLRPLTKEWEGKDIRIPLETSEAQMVGSDDAVIDAVNAIIRSECPRAIWCQFEFFERAPTGIPLYLQYTGHMGQ